MYFINPAIVKISNKSQTRDIINFKHNITEMILTESLYFNLNDLTVFYLHIGNRTLNKNLGNSLTKIYKLKQ